MTVQFHANSAQYRFIEKIKPHDLGLFCAGVGIGKSTLLREVACILAMYNPGVRGFIASHVLNHVRVELIPLLIKRLKEFRNFGRWVRQDRLIYCRNGATIQYGSADRPDSLEGWNVGWALGDEIRFWRKDAHDAFMARFRVKDAILPFVGFFTTPEMNWMYQVYGEYVDPRFFLVQGSTIENAYNLREGYFDDLKQRLSAKKFEQYAEGKWVSLAGQVFDEFDADLHIDAFELVSHLPVHCGVDPGYRRPAVVFFQHVELCSQHKTEDCIHVIDELTPNNTPTQRLAPLMVAKFKKWGWRRGNCYIDPAAYSKQTASDFTDVDVLVAHGFQCGYTRSPSSVNIRNGIEAIRAKLRNAENKPSLFVQPLRGRGHERGIINALMLTQYPEIKIGRVDHDLPIVDERKDILDALRYAIVNLFPPLSSKIIVG